MKSAITSRLATLRAEFEKGQEQLRELQAQQARLTESMLRIEGAIAVLAGLQAEEAQFENGDGTRERAEQVSS